MLAVDRRKFILKRVTIENSITVSQLAEELTVTEETIRRDLLKLENDGLINRVHGGATIKSQEKEDLPYSTRNIQHTEEKKKIAEIAINLIPDSASIMADSSSTVFGLIKEIDEKIKDAVVITNSSYLVFMFNSSSIRLISTGGTLRRNSYSLVGSLAMEALNKYYADFGIFSCKAISLDGFVMDSNEQDADIKKIMLQKSKKIILLADSSKFSKKSFVNMFELTDIDVIVTDKRPENQWIEACKKYNIELFY